MNFFDSYWDAAAAISSRSGRREFIAAVVEYYYSGGVEPQLRNAQAKVAFAAVRFSLDRAIRGRKNRASEDSGPLTPPPRKKGKEGRRAAEARRDPVEPGPSRTSFRVISGRTEHARLSPHALACLSEMNRVLGTDCWIVPPQAAKALDDSSEAYSPADVGSMAAMVAAEADGAVPDIRDILDPSEFYRLMERALLMGCVDDRCGREDALEL